jgi:LysM repeat protein
MVPRHLFSQTDAATRLTRINTFENALARVSQQQQISIVMLKAIIAVESSGNALAGIERTIGAKGLMQIIDQTWRNTVQRFPNVFFQNQPLTKFMNREENNYWQNPELNILIGALAIRLKATALSRYVGKTVNPADHNDMVLIFTAYNAGEFTTGEAYNNAIKGGSKQPQFDLLMPEYLEPAIQTVVERFKLGWNISKKYDEISEYAGKVLGFMDLLHQQHTGVINNPTNNNPTIQNNAIDKPAVPVPQTVNNTIYIVVAGDTGAAIARKMNINFDVLQRANNNVNWSRLSVGQKLNIPVTVNTNGNNNTNSINTSANNQNTRAPRTHLVKRGDNLSNLANIYKTTETALKVANPTKLKRWGDVEGFSVGETIIIP